MYKMLMQLKTVGESLNALNSIRNILNNTTLSGVEVNIVLANSLKSYSTEAIKSAIAQSTLNEEQIRAILIEKGLTGQLLETTTAELAQATTTNALAVSEGVATTATVGLGNAFKGLGASMKAFALSHPVLLAIAAVGVTVYGVVKAYDALTVSVEEANEAMQDAVGEYDSAKSSLESVNTELEEQNKKIDELLSKDKLTYAEKGQLEELQAITQELLLQQDIEQRRADKASKDVAEKTVDAYEKQYGRYDKTEDDLKEMLSYDNFPLPDSTDDVLGMIAAYIRAQELLEQSQKEFDDAVKNGEDTTWLAEDVQSNIDAVNDFSQSLDENISDLHDKRTALEDEYNKAIEKQTKGIEPLTSLDKDVIETYESIHDTMKMIYEYTDPNKWNSMEISNIFNTEGIEKTKEELISMYKSGELSSSEMLEQFPKLNQAIKESEIIAGEGSDAFKEFFNEIAALADETEDTVNGVLDQVKVSLSITDTVEQLNTQLKPAFDSLQSAWKDIFTDDGFELNSIDILSTCDSIKSKLDEMSDPEGLNLDVDYSAFEDFVNVLNNTESTEQNVQDAFDSLATSITQAALSGAEDFETMRAALEDLGVINNELVAFDAMISNTEALKEAGLDLADASDEQIAAFANESVAAENVTQAIAMLTFHKELCNAQEMNTAGEVANLKTLAENAGYTGEVIQYLTELEQIYQEVASGTINPAMILAKTARAAMLKSYIDSAANNINYEPKVDFTKATDSAKKAGSKSGKKAADKYLEAFEKELEKLQGMRDRNEITEKEYLDNLRALYEKYFKDREKYIDEFKKYEHEYLEGLESEYRDVMNGIIKLMDKQSDKYEEMKDSAVDSYNAQKDAAEDAYDAQIENIDAQIEAINDQIDAIDAEIEAKKKQADAIQDEIDKIKEAREERQKQLDLQKDLYELERMQHQRTILQYSEQKGMHYVADTSGIRDAKEKVDQDREDLHIMELEKQIDLINDEIDLLEERKGAFEDQIDGLEKQKDAIEKMKDASNDYFESMIKQTETYYDKLIESLDKTKSRWEELADLKEEAEMKGKMEEILSQYGVTADDVVNMSEETFQAFKNDYLAILSDLYSGNEQMQSAIAETAGTTTDQLESYIAKTQEYIDSLISMDMSDTATSMDNTAESMDKLSTATSDANENTKAMSENMGTLSTNTAELGENATAVSDALSSIPDAEKFNVLTTSFTNLAEAIKSVADALGVSGNSTVSSLVDTLRSLSTISIDADGNGLITQFNNLKTAIEGVTSAISGGGMSGGSAGEGSPSSSPSMSAGAGGKGAAVGGLISAVEGIKTATDEALGTGGGEDGEGGGTGAIGQFEQLKDAVDDVTASIGGGGSSESGQGSGGSEGDNADSLIGSIVELGDTTEEILTGGGESEGGSSGVIGRFEEFSDVIEEAKDHVTGISEGLDEIDGKEVECTIRVNIETNGSLPAFAEGTLGDMNLESGEYTAKYGKAFAEGTGKYKGLPKAEKNALVSEYGQTEMTVLPNGDTIITDEPTMMDLPKDTVIFNEEQTKKIMDNKVHVDGGANTSSNGDVVQPNGDILKPDGTVIKPNGVAIQSDGTIITPEGKVYEPLRPGDRMYDMLQKFNAYFNSIDQNVEKLTPNSFYDHQKQMEQMANQVTNYNSVVNNNKNVQPVVNHNQIHVTLPNVTDSTCATELLRDLQSINTKKYQVFG